MLKKLLKNSSIYLGTEILNKAIPFLLLPIITKHLSPTEYGIYGMYQVLISFVVPFIGMNLYTHITRNYFKISKEKLSEILNSILVLLHFHTLLALIVVFIISLFISNPLGIENRYLYILPIIIYIQMINTFNLTILRNQEKALKYGIIQIIISIFNFSSVLLLLLFFNMGWMSLVYGLLIGNFIVFLYSFYYMKVEYNLKFNIFYSFKKIYLISLPLIFHLIGATIIFLSDRIFIQQMQGLKAVGLYSVGNQFAIITLIVLNSIVLAINPWMYKKLANNENILKYIYLLMGLFLIIGVVIWLSTLFIFPYMVDSKYFEAKNVIFWISIGFVFRGWYQLFYNVILNEGKTKIFMYITLGPDKLPEAMKDFARVVKKLKKMWKDATSDITRELELEDMKEEVKKYKDELNKLQNETKLPDINTPVDGIGSRDMKEFLK